MTTLVYRPVPAEPVRTLELNPRPDRLDGLRLGLVGNWKPNADVLLKEVGRLLSERHGVAEVVFREKHSCSMPAPIAMLDELAGRCDVALTAMGDCGSCTTWCVNDAIELERRGVPTLAFVATPFMVLARYELEPLGVPEEIVAEVQRYPFGPLPAEEIHDEAVTVLPHVADLLTRQVVAA